MLRTVRVQWDTHAETLPVLANVSAFATIAGFDLWYFANKETLVDRVYQQTFLARSDPSWPKINRDRTTPLREP